MAMRMLVVGAGSTGGYYGGRLAQAGRDVTFLVRPARAQHLRDNGLQIVSPYGDFTLQPKVITADEIDGHYDAILFTVKAYSMDAAIADLAPAVGPDTMILPTLNGMRHMDVLSKRFTPRNVPGFVCKIMSTIDDKGRIVQLSKLQDLAYGELDGTASDRMKALDAFMQNAGFPARLTPVIAREMWEKWTLLAALGGITCLMRGNVGEILSAAGGKDFILALLDEVVSVVRKVGVAPSPEFITSTTGLLTTNGSVQTSSMYRDLEKGAAVEADQIVGDMLARGQAASLVTPLLAAAYTSLSVYQNRLPK
jgi:2-dehydropantoate 2-reductase